MPTERLYFEDPALLEFDARVLEIRASDGRPRVVLDRSAFYPEGGGQLADRGVLAGAAVLDVQTDPAGVVEHRVEGPLPELGTSVHCRVDGARRRVHRALHTGQHILSRALFEVAGAETVSARLGESQCTIDLELASLDDALVARAEELANSVVDDDLEVRAWFPSLDELSSLPLRRAPKVETEVRVVAVGDFDFTPCGGTHCVRTAQVGVVRVSGTERHKGGTRVSFAAGERSRRLLVSESNVLRAMALELSSAPMDVPVALAKLSRELQAARESLGRLRAEVAERVAEELAARAGRDPVVIARLPGAAAEVLRAVAARVTKQSNAVALLCGATPDGLPVVATRGASASFDCGAFVKALARRTGGRGGGRPEHAEGRLPLDADFEGVARALVAALPG